MFAYCNNNPVKYIDPDGHRFLGFGFQFEIQVGDISYGFEIIIYTDPTVCGDKSFLVVSYCYSGYDISIGDLQQTQDLVETLITTFAFETDCINIEMFYSAVTVIYNGAGVSGGAFLLFGDDDFVSPSDYSGGFETWSFSAKIKAVTATFFHSFSDTCDAYGFKIGAHFDGLQSRTLNPFGITYSRSDYSDPCVWGE